MRKSRVRAPIEPPCAWLWALLLMAAPACKAGPPEHLVCEDSDDDGYGVNCARGPDCDDTDPRRTRDCTGPEPPDCEATPNALGCACLLGDREVCYDGAPETAGVGPCKPGVELCVEGAWGACEGQVLPAGERCNGADDDCDGFTDEGVLSPCGGCDDSCRGGVWGPPAVPFTPDSPLAVDASGQLTLEWQAYDARVLWVPNTDEGSVSKLDVVEARELARYRTRGAYPIRVAVDHRGDAWVLDGSFGGVAYLSKLAGDEARCKDRDGDGLQTSHAASALPLGQDECVILETPLSAAGDDPRALAVDGALAPDSERAGDVWLGFSASRSLLQLAGDDARVLQRRDLGDFKPYSAAFDRYGTLWMIDRAGVLASVDPNDAAAAPRTRPVPFACYSLEALSIEAAGRVLLSGFGCENLFSYDTLRDTWHTADVPDLLSPRGIASPAAGSWVVFESGKIASLSREPLEIVERYSLAQDFTPYESVALSADGLGRLWAISTQGGPDGVGLATRFDPEQAKVTAQVPVGAGPRGSGDLSGYASGGAYAREGTLSHVFGGCGREARDTSGLEAGTHWLRLHVASITGFGASVEVAARHASDEAGLADAAYLQLGTLPAAGDVFALAFPDGGVVEVQLRLRSPAALGAPRVARVGLEWSCPGPD